MVFSSPIFLFGFLPLILLGYFFAGKSGRNLFLLVASLFFYAWGEPIFVLLLIFSILANYGLALRLRGSSGEGRKISFWVVISLNLGLLFLFKYLPFVVGNLQLALESWGLGSRSSFAWVDSWPAMPIGISFFTFQALSYVFDVTRGVCPVQRNPLKLGLYIAMFPQLIAGPIVRYSEIRQQIDERHWNLDSFSQGAIRFTIGLAKKVLVADTVARVAEVYFSISSDALSTPAAWIGVLCFAVQIYFDFSGYSDMAIGIGKMLGFRYPENFNYPYISRNVREFWRRWHMTLSRWFRDYLYIPMGGSRVTSWRMGLNLLTVFVLCGLWHGASWNFLIWGLFHGVFMSLERTKFGSFLESLPRIAQHFYLLMVVLVSWVFFRSETVSGAFSYLAVMFTWQGGDPLVSSLSRHLGNDALLALSVGVILSSPFALNLARGIQGRVIRTSWQASLVQRIGALLLLAVSVLVVASNAYSPFLYFRF